MELYFLIRWQVHINRKDIYVADSYKMSVMIKPQKMKYYLSIAAVTGTRINT